MIRPILLSVALVFLTGCPYDPDRIQINPKIKDIIGLWEGRGLSDSIPYSLVELRLDGTGDVVVSGETGAEVYAEIKEIRFFRNSFEFELHHLKEKEKLFTLTAQLVYGQICITKMDGEAFFEKKGPIWCFVREQKLDQYKKNAIKSYNAFKKENV